MQKGNQKMTIAEEFSQKMKAQNAKSKVIQIAPVIVLIALMIFFMALEPSFLSAGNIRALLNQLSIPLILALGLTFVVLMGSIDLSVDGVMGLAASLVSLLILNDKNVVDLGFFGLILTIMVTGAIGLLSGFIHVKGRIPSFMVTFAMSSIAAGIGILSYQGIPANIEYPLIKEIANNDIGGLVPITFLVALGVFVITFIIQRYTSHGRYIYAIGQNENIPRVSGVNVDKVKILTFMLAGILIGVAGILSAGKLARGTILSGQNQLFPALTAVVVGGTSLSGGKGSVVNTLLGAAIVTVLQNGLFMLGVEPEIQTGVQGLIILAAVALSVTRGRKQVVK